jgi:hypothetical protein
MNERLLDQQVFAVLRASGGWNATARARLAAFAGQRGIPMDAVLASAMRAAAMLAAPAGPASPGGVDASGAPAPTSVPDTAAPAEARRRAFMPTWVGAVALAIATAISACMTWFAVERAAVESPTDRGAPASARPEVRADGIDPGAIDPTPPTSRASSSGQPRPSGDSAAPLAPRGPSVPPVPAMYARPPVLRIDAAPEWSRAAVESLASDEPALEEASARLGAGAPATDADRALFARVVESFCGAWPTLDARLRTESVERIGRIARMDERASERVDALDAAARSAPSTPEGIWRGSGASGLAAALRAGPGRADEAFTEAIGRWLGDRAPSVADAVLSGSPSVAADAVDAWLTAAEGALAGEAVDARVLAILDMLLRRGAPFERPGVSADAGGTLLDALGWTGPAPARAAIAMAFEAWLEDPSVPTTALHGLTSVLAARRPGPWWTPWLVVDARADSVSRRRTGERFREALAAGVGEPAEADAGSLRRPRGIPADAIDRWLRAAGAVESRRADGDPAERLVHAAECIALVEAARLLERGLLSDAMARTDQAADPQGISLDELDRWVGRSERPAGRRPATDGRLAGELQARTVAEDRKAVLRGLRARAIGDLGPQDAHTLATEALRSPSPDMRSVAQGVVADTFMDGANVLSALAAEAAAAADAGELAQLASTLTGELPPRGTDAQVRAASIVLLLDRHAALSPADRHRIDSVAQEFTLSASAAARAAGGEGVPPGARPEDAFRAWLDARRAEVSGRVPTPTLDAIAERLRLRRALASPGPQAMVAEQVALLELDAAILAERHPRLQGRTASIVRDAASARARAADAIDQVVINALAQLALARVALDPAGVEP